MFLEQALTSSHFLHEQLITRATILDGIHQKGFHASCTTWRFRKLTFYGNDCEIVFNYDMHTKKLNKCSHSVHLY